MIDIDKINFLNNAFQVMGKNMKLQSNSTTNQGFAAVMSMIGETRKNLKASEHIVEKGIVNDASLQDITTSVSVAETNLRLLVAVRDSMVTMWQEIVKMQI